jgi:hypothetical protein
VNCCGAFTCCGQVSAGVRLAAAALVVAAATTATFAEARCHTHCRMDAIPAWCEVASKLRSGHSLNRTSPGTLRLRRLAAPVLGQTWGQGAPCCTSRCAPTRAAPFESLTTWLSGRGGAISDLGLEPCELPGGAVVRGLVATAHHEAGDTLMSVPLGAALRDDAAPEPYPGAPWNACLAALLLQERARGRDSAWAPYLATLPGCQDCDDTGLLLLPDDMLSELQYAPAAAALAAYRTTVASAHAATAAQWHGHGACPGWREWAWATHMVQSRSIRLAIAGCRVMIPGAARQRVHVRMRLTLICAAALFVLLLLLLLCTRHSMFCAAAAAAAHMA